MTEATPITPALESWFSERLREERFDQQLVLDLVDILGWDEARAVIESGMPSVRNVRKGVFGEVLAAECIAEFDGYVVPVKKLRSMITSGQSLPGTDVLAFLLDSNGQVARATYIEAKLRTHAEPGVGVEAEQQLARDMSARFPQILLFVANQLYQSQSPLTGAVRGYMMSRERGESLDEFRIHLTWEATAWSDEVLDRIEESPPLLEPLTACAAVVRDLDALVTRVYAAIGVGVDTDGD